MFLILFGFVQLFLFDDELLRCYCSYYSVDCVTGIPELLSSSPTLGKETQHTQKKGIKMRDSN